MNDVADAVRAAFADQEQVLLPILALVENARASIDEPMNGAARGFVELAMWRAQKDSWRSLAWDERRAW